MKKVLIIIAFIIVIGAGVGGTLYFYKQNQNQIEQNAQLVQQNAQVQSQLNAIGAMTTAYEVVTKCYSGNQIKETDLIQVSVPVSTTNTYSITDKAMLVGKYYRIDVNPGTILSADMLMAEPEDVHYKFTRELTVTSLPVTTVKGDYVDIRMILPNGEELVVFAHKRIEDLYECTMTFYMSEEENLILNSALQEYGNYSSYVLLYVTKYLEPGNDTDTIAFYPVQHEMENMVKFNPNIVDKTRCINESMRDHIDKVLLIYTDDDNAAVSSTFISSLSSQFASQLAMHQNWVDEHTGENGELVVEGEGASGTGDGSVDFDQQVGQAYEDLEQGLGDLEAIQ